MGHGKGGHLTEGGKSRRNAIYRAWRPHMPLPNPRQEAYVRGLYLYETTNAAARHAGVDNKTARRWEDTPEVWDRLEQRWIYIMEHAPRSLPPVEDMLRIIWEDATTAVNEGSYKAGLEAKLKVFEIAKKEPPRAIMNLSGDGSEDEADLDRAKAILTEGE